VVIIVDFQAMKEEARKGGTLTPHRHPLLHYFHVLRKRRSNSCNYVVATQENKKRKKRRGQEE
jgi:hypothetical protein